MAETEQNVTMSPQKRFILGGIGALLPIIVSLTTLPDITASPDLVWKIVGALIRDTALFFLGGFIAYVHDDEVKPFKIVEIGIAAPAFILTLTTSNGMSNEQNKVSLLEQNIKTLQTQLDEFKKPEMKSPKLSSEPPVETPKPSGISFDFSLVKSANAGEKEQKTLLAESKFLNILKGMVGDVSSDIQQTVPVNPVSVDTSLIKATAQPLDTQKKLYRFYIFINSSQEELDKIRQVDYALLHRTIINTHVVATDVKNKFLHSYDGWGCLTSVIVTISYKDNTTKRLDFDMCKSLGPDWSY